VPAAATAKSLKFLEMFQSLVPAHELQTIEEDETVFSYFPQNYETLKNSRLPSSADILIFDGLQSRHPQSSENLLLL
jgi:hypothetical protein